MNDAKDDQRDPLVSRAYAEASRDEPPSTLDAAILAASRAAVSASAKSASRPWWRRLQAPLALAATVFLAVALSLSVDHNPPQEASLPLAAPVERPAIRATPATPERNEAADQPPTAPEPHASPPPAAPARATPAPRSAPAAKLEATAPPAPIASPSAAESGAPSATSPALRSSEVSQADSTPGERRKSAIAAPPAAARAGPAAPDPEDWIAEIRALLRAGQKEEAARQLREFRAAWPEHPLPADLRLPGP
jgi:hypothetical protein